MKKIIGLLGIAVFLLFSRHSLRSKEDFADKVYINGKIITVNDKNDIVQAIGIKDGKIIKIGSNEEVDAVKGKSTQVIDLQGKTVVPGFIDGHSHFMDLGSFSTVSLAAPPVGPVGTIGDIVQELSKHKEKEQLKAGEWIFGFGYDQDQLEEKRHPTKEDLDRSFPDNPVLVVHISGHMLVANSTALRLAGINSDTKNPDGGIIIRKADGKEPTGLLQESAQYLVQKVIKVKELSLEEKIDNVKKQQQYYASYGVTTAQDGFTSAASLELLQKAAQEKALFIDLVLLPSYQLLDKILENGEQATFGKYNNRLKLEGIKLSSDGSPQGKTAFFTKPYLTEVPGCSDHCTGVPTITQEQFDNVARKCFQNNLQLFTHCNGDGAIDMYISAIETVNKELSVSHIGRRPVVIHSQFARKDQLLKYKELGLLPSFFSNHAFFWGDVHIRNLGKERAAYLSPMHDALQIGLSFTNHTDYPVTPINQLFLLWTAINRKTRSGYFIGVDQRLTPLEALRTVTINGAYQYFEEDSKGSIEVGKLADLVILSADLTKVHVDDIKDIEVLETIKEGQSIFKRNQQNKNEL